MQRCMLCRTAIRQPLWFCKMHTMLPFCPSLRFLRPSLLCPPPPSPHPHPDICPTPFPMHALIHKQALQLQTRRYIPSMHQHPSARHKPNGTLRPACLFMFSAGFDTCRWASLIHTSQRLTTSPPPCPTLPKARCDPAAVPASSGPVPVPCIFCSAALLAPHRGWSRLWLPSNERPHATDAPLIVHIQQLRLHCHSSLTVCPAARPPQLPCKLMPLLRPLPVVPAIDNCHGVATAPRVAPV
jgi:hypothetical protein